MKLHHLPAPVLACVLSVQRLYPATRAAPCLDGSVHLEIPHPAGGFLCVEIGPADLDSNGQRPVWLAMLGLPFGKIKLIGSQAVAVRIKTMIDAADEPHWPHGGER